MQATPPKARHETLFEPRFTHPGVYLLPVILLPALSAAVGIIAARLAPGRMLEWPFVVLGALGSLTVIAKWMVDIHRVRRVIRTNGRFLCLNCHYALKGLPDSGTCPECEYPYERATTERRWKTWEETMNKGKPMV